MEEVVAGAVFGDKGSLPLGSLSAPLQAIQDFPLVAWPERQ